MKDTDLLIIAAVGIAGYYLYTKVAGPIADAADTLTSPITSTPTGYPDAPSLGNLLVPVTGAGVVSDWLQTPIGGKGTPSVSFGGSLFPPLAFAEATSNLVKEIIKPTSKTATGYSRPGKTAAEVIATRKIVSQPKKALTLLLPTKKAQANYQAFITKYGRPFGGKK